MGFSSKCVQCGVRLCLNFPIYILSAIVAWSYYTVVFIICSGWVRQTLPNWLFILPYHCSLSLFLWSFWRASRTLPAAIPKQYCLSPSETIRFIELDTDHARAAYLEQLVNDKALPITLHNKHGKVPFCDVCFLIKPDRAHHCSSCEKCIAKMDHHCPWINNCVGFHNQKYFLLFLFHAVCYCLLCFLSTLKFFINFVNNHLDMDLPGVHTFFLFVISMVFAIAVSALLVFQMVLLFKNSSTLEHFRDPKFRKPAVHRSFDLGCKANFLEVFGQKPSLWCIPVFSSKGDGFSFPIRTSDSEESRALLLYNV